MTQFLGAKELQSFVVNLLGIYDYTNGTKVGFLFYLTQGILSHPKLN
jgi:hypothetical protein